MQQLVFLLAVLACPVGMGLMMWFMMKGMGGMGMGGQNGQNANAHQPMVTPTWQPRADQEPAVDAHNDRDARDEDIAALQGQIADLERQNRRLAEQLDRFGAQAAPGTGGLRNADRLG